MGKVNPFKRMIVKGLLIPHDKYKGDGLIDSHVRIVYTGNIRRLTTPIFLIRC